MAARSRRLFRFLFVTALVFAGVFAVGEVVARVFSPRVEPLSLVALPEVLKGQEAVVFDGAAGWRLAPGLKDARLFGTVVTTNGSGLRCDHETGPKRRGQLRILCLGGAGMFGAGLGDALPWPQLLEAELRRRLPGHDIEVINGACPGDTLLRVEARLPGLLARLSPDFVMVQCFEEDVAVEGFLDSEELGRLSGVQRAAGWSRLASWWLSRKSRGVAGDAVLSQVPLPRVGLEDYVLGFIRLKRLGITAGVQMFGIAPRFMDEAGEGTDWDRAVDYQKSVQGVAAWHQVPFPDFGDFNVEEHAEARGLFLSRYRLNAEGHAVMAQRLGENMSRDVKLRLTEIAESYPEAGKGFIQ